MAADRTTGMLNQPQLRAFAPAPSIQIQDAGTNTQSPIMPTQNQIGAMMPGTLAMAKGGFAQRPDELSGIKDVIRQEFASRGLDFDRFIKNPAVMDEVGRSMAQHGQSGDSIVAHINPKEAELLKKHGGSGTINPATGLPQFADDSSSSNQDPGYSGGGGGYSASGGEDSPSESGPGPGMGGGGGYSANGGEDSPSESGPGPGMGGGGSGLTFGGSGNDTPTLTGGGGNDNNLSPFGAGNPTVNMGQTSQPTDETANGLPSFANNDLSTGLPTAASNLSGLGQLATTSTPAPGLGTFAGGGNAPTSELTAGLSNVQFNAPVTMGMTPGVNPSIANASFPDAAAMERLNDFQWSGAEPVNPAFSQPTSTTTFGSGIVPTGSFGPLTAPRAADPIADLATNDPAKQMQAAMNIMSGARGIGSDIVATANNFASVPQLSGYTPAQIMTGMDKAGITSGDYATSGAAPTQSLEDMMGTAPQGNPLFAGMDLTTKTVPNTATINVPKAYDLYNPVLASAPAVYSGLISKLTGVDPVTGQPAVDPVTGEPVTPSGTWTPGSTMDPKLGVPTSGVATWNTPTFKTEEEKAAYDAAIKQYSPAMNFTPQGTATSATTNWGSPGLTDAPSVLASTAPENAWNMESLPTETAYTPFAGSLPSMAQLPQNMDQINPIGQVVFGDLPSTNPALANAVFPNAAQSTQLASGNWSPTDWSFNPVSSAQAAPIVVEPPAPAPMSPLVAASTPAPAPSLPLVTQDPLANFPTGANIPLPPERPVFTAEATTPFSDTAPTTPVPEDLFAGQAIPLPPTRPDFTAVVESLPPEAKAQVTAEAGTSTNPPANTDAPQTEYDKEVAALEAADKIANGMSKEEYADAMGVPVEDVQTRITTAFGEPMAEYYTKSWGDALAGITGGQGAATGAMNLMSLFSPMGILGLMGKAAYNQYMSGLSPNTAPQSGLPTSGSDTTSGNGKDNYGGQSQRQKKKKYPLEKADGGYIMPSNTNSPLNSMYQMPYQAPQIDLGTGKIWGSDVPTGLAPVQQPALPYVAPQITVPQSNIAAPQINMPTIDLSKFATPYTGISPDYKPPAPTTPTTPSSS